MVRRLLRYNTRHHLYWRLGHGRGWRPRYPGDEAVKMGWPRLNPVDGMIYGNQIRNISVHEPLWLFRLRQRLFCCAGRQRCGRRNDVFAFNHGDGDAPDTWDWGPDGNRTCSYCGSLHPDDLMKICRLVIDDERYGIEGTTKSYKVYVTQPGVRNASEGAIKFYMHHAPAEPSNEDQELFREAVATSRERFNARMRDRFGAR